MFRFEQGDKKLILEYFPEYGSDYIIEKLNKSKSWRAKNCFVLTKDLLVDSNGDYLYFEIGELVGEYYRIYPSVTNTKNIFYFSTDRVLNQKMFVAYRYISILSKIDHVIDSDMYIGGDREDSIPWETYLKLLKTFPTSSELNRYADARVGNILQEYFDNAHLYIEAYERFMQRRKVLRPQHEPPMVFESFNKLTEFEQFSLMYDRLRYLLATDAVERDLQNEIQQIVSLLYPKYIVWDTEVTIPRKYGFDGHDKRPDFLLLDANGFVDAMEIKRPGVQLLAKNQYRNNYVPTKDFAGAIQQIEKYIYCLGRWGKEGEDKIDEKLNARLPDGVTAQIVNPQGLLIAGRSNDFNRQQKSDFEVIKRQYNHVADIMTYDDLLFRIKSIRDSLQKEIGLN